MVVKRRIPRPWSARQLDSNPVANRGPGFLGEGVNVHGMSLQLGLRDDEIEDVWERIEDLFEDIDDRKIRVFESYNENHEGRTPI